jgi:hypothetical protein
VPCRLPTSTSAATAAAAAAAAAAGAPRPEGTWGVLSPSAALEQVCSPSPLMCATPTSSSPTRYSSVELGAARCGGLVDSEHCERVV